LREAVNSINKYEEPAMENTQTLQIHFSYPSGFQAFD